MADYFDPNLGSKLLSIVNPADRVRFSENNSIMHDLSGAANEMEVAHASRAGASGIMSGAGGGQTVLSGSPIAQRDDDPLLKAGGDSSSASAPMVDPFSSGGSGGGGGGGGATSNGQAGGNASAAAAENATRKNYLTLAMHASMDPTMQRLPPRSLNPWNTSANATSTSTSPGTDGTIWTIFCTKTLLLITMCSVVLRFVATTVSEIFSLWAITTFSQNGIGFSTSQISFCFLAQGATILVFQLFCFKPLTQRFPISGMYQIAMCVHAFHAFIIPFLQPLAERNWPGFWFVLILIFVARGAALAVAYTGGTLLLNNSVTDARAGAVFGLVESFASLGQAIGPLIGSVTLAWSEGNGAPSPFDYHIMFVLLGLFALTGAISARNLPPEIERRIESRIRPKPAS